MKLLKGILFRLPPLLTYKDFQAPLNDCGSEAKPRDHCWQHCGRFCVEMSEVDALGQEVLTLGGEHLSSRHYVDIISLKPHNTPGCVTIFSYFPLRVTDKESQIWI